MACAWVHLDPTPGLAGASRLLDVGKPPTYKGCGLLWGTYITICVIFLCISIETGFGLVATRMSVAKVHLQKG